MVDPGHPALSVRRQCELLGLSRSSLYYEPGGEAAEDLRLMRRIDEQYTARPFYGSRRMTVWVNEHGGGGNRKRGQRLMRGMGLEAIYPKPRLSLAGKGHRIYPYLLRGVKVERRDQVWSTEIVHSQMTKPAGLAGRPDRERITDLDVVPGHHDPVDQQFDQLPPPLERRRVEAHPHPVGERSGAVRGLAQLVRPARFARERLLLGRQHAVTAFQLLAPAPVLAQGEHAAQVRLGEP